MHLRSEESWQQLSLTKAHQITLSQSIVLAYALHLTYITALRPTCKEFIAILPSLAEL